MGLMPANALWEDILAQGENLAHVVAHLYGPERARLDAAGRALSGTRPLIFIGVASAAYLCLPAITYLGSQGRVASIGDWGSGIRRSGIEKSVKDLEGEDCYP